MRKKILIILMFIVMLIGIYYTNNNGTTKTISYNVNNLRINIDGETSSTLPTSGTYYLVNYDCKSSNTKVGWDKDNHKLNISNGTKKGGITCNLEFKSKPLLSEMPIGSYVAYTGDSENGCDAAEVNGWTSCSGKNANYVSDTDMGYCNNSNYKFHVNGWRIGYVEDRIAHLISAGATDCMCSDSSGAASDSSCSGNLSSTNLYKHFENMNNVALKYCNIDYVEVGLCITNDGDENNTVWAMNANDFKKITRSTLSSGSCYNKYSNMSCGYSNDLIDNGGYYSIATAYSASSNYAFEWNPYNRNMHVNNSNYLNGVRPVIALESSIIVVGGDGTYENPYIISNNKFTINDGVSYISSSADKSQVQLKLNASDDVSKMCISVNTSVCTNYVDYSDTYTLDWSDEADGEKVVYVYYKDSSGDIVASMNESIIVDTTAPTNNSVTISVGTSTNRILTLSSTGATKMCFSNTSSNASDCTNWVNYATTHNWTLNSGDGTKTVYAFFKDDAGNISSATSTTTISPDSGESGGDSGDEGGDSSETTEYKYWMDASNVSNIYLMRSDGATAKVSGNATTISWYSENSNTMYSCTTDLNKTYQVWCLGLDGNIYYKNNVTLQSWNMIDTNNLIDISPNVKYFLHLATEDDVYIIRDDGMASVVSATSIERLTWGYGTLKSMASCTGYNFYVACVGNDGYLYYRNDLLSTTDYLGGNIMKLDNRSYFNTWIDFVSGSDTVSIIEVDYTTSSVFNSMAAKTSGSATWFTSNLPGSSNIKTCTSTFGGTGATIYNICLAEDGYLYHKGVSATSWTKLSLKVE